MLSSRFLLLRNTSQLLARSSVAATTTNIRNYNSASGQPWKKLLQDSKDGRGVPKLVMGAEAMQVIQSHQRIFIHSTSAYPKHLVDCMTQLADARGPTGLNNVEICHIHVEGFCPYSQPKYKDVFHTTNFFVGASQREAVQSGISDFVPIFLSEISSLFKSGQMPIDVALVQVSPPDAHGFCSLGTSVDISLEAVEAARVVIAQVNDQVPRTHGDGLIHVSKLNYLVEHNEALPSLKDAAVSTDISQIGTHIASLIEDGSTLQMGIGQIPDAVLSSLTSHKDLGIHTEMFANGVIDLVRRGVITNRHKKIARHHILGSFLMGSKELYDFVDDNPLVHLAPSSYVNDPSVIKQNPKVVAINSAVEIDLTGQVCADSAGTRIISGIGGQMDFMRGAALSEGGKPIIAVQSRSGKNQPKIVPVISPGAGIVTTRAHVHWVVTEYGKVNLFGLNLRQRARALIDVAHPDDRQALFDAAAKRFPNFSTVH